MRKEHPNSLMYIYSVCLLHSVDCQLHSYGYKPGDVLFDMYAQVHFTVKTTWVATLSCPCGN